jgi:hypothetical protein
MKSRHLFIFRGVFAIFVFAAAPAYAIVAGQPDSVDAKVIDECLTSVADAKADPNGCIGRVSKGCLEKASDVAAIKECSNRESLVWNAREIRDYAQLTKLLRDDSVTQVLREAERSYVIAKLKKCTFERISHKNSAKSLASEAECEATSTARQDLWLTEQIDSFKN